MGVSIPLPLPLALGGTGQKTMPLAAAALGVPGMGQAWGDVFGTRAINVAYTNTTGKPLCVCVSVSVPNAYGYRIDIDGVPALHTESAAFNAQWITVFFIVPAGATYKVVVTSGTLQKWYELRDA